MFSRRGFLAATAATFASGSTSPSILLSNGWQSENIGDIAHTPGMLSLLEKHVPEARTILFSKGLDRGVRELLLKRFPKLTVIESFDMKPGSALSEAYQTANLFLHGSGAGVNTNHLQLWQERTKKPSGIFGVTVSTQPGLAGGSLTSAVKAVLDKASFVLTRETLSLKNLREAQVRATHIGFAPDSTFSFDLKNDQSASRYLEETGLSGTKFIAVIPRLRYTPYHEFKKVTISEDEIKRRVAINERHKEEDHAKLREVVIAWVRKTGGKVLLCPEMTYELNIIGPLLYDPLPSDVKPSVVQRKTYWLPDEAASVYRHAQAVVSCECHSPILAAVFGTPCFYVRQPEDTIKGQMWSDIGLGDWAPHIEKITGPMLADLVLSTCARRDLAQARVRRAVAKAQSLQTAGIQVLRKSLHVANAAE